MVGVSSSLVKEPVRARRHPLGPAVRVVAVNSWPKTHSS